MSETRRVVGWAAAILHRIEARIAGHQQAIHDLLDAKHAIGRAYDGLVESGMVSLPCMAEPGCTSSALVERGSPAHRRGFVICEDHQSKSHRYRAHVVFEAEGADIYQLENAVHGVFTDVNGVNLNIKGVVIKREAE